jgi:hypothetical protein
LGESKPTRIGCRHSQDVELKTLAYAAGSARTLSVVGVKVSVDFDTERIYRHQNQRTVATSDLATIGVSYSILTGQAVGWKRCFDAISGSGHNGGHTRVIPLILFRFF